MRDDIMRIKEDLCHFMADAAKEGIGPHNVEMISAAAVGAEKIMKMAVLEEELMGEGGYSGRGYSQEGGYSGEDGYSGGYDDGESYRRGRDSRGRFTRRGGYSRDGGYSGEGGYSQAGGYSQGGSYGGGNYNYSRNNEKQNMIQQMRRMAEQAGPEEKKTIERMIRNLENG